jgi:Tol biopolymer transport system component
MVKQADIDAQLQRILASPVFVGSPRSAQFLHFCVRNSSGKKTVELKETTIAVGVFNRAPDYNPKIDPIVRVHARRVRDKLDEYYRTDGNDDPIRIDLPKGGYVPRISRTLPNRKTDFTDWAEERAAPSDEAAGRSTVLANVGEKKRTPSTWLLLACIAIGLVGVIFLWRLSRATKSAASSTRTLQQLNFPDHASDPAWSPDGSRLAFASTDATTGRSHIYLYTPASGAAPVRLTHDDAAEMTPAWSPDGQRIAFIRRIAPARFEIVCERIKDATTTTFGPFNVLAYVAEDHPALDWSPDGATLLTAEQMSPSSPMRLVLISIATGDRVALTSPPTGSTGDIEGKFSPDGKLVAFRRGGLGDLYVVSTRGEQNSPANRLTRDMHGVRGIAWTDGGRSILFGTNDGPTNHYGIWKIPAAGGPMQQMTPANFEAIEPAVTRDGRFVFTHAELATAFVRYSLMGASPGEPLFPSAAVDMDPAISPDGKLLAFSSTRSGPEQLWIGRIGDSAPRQVTHFDGKQFVFFPAWSPDSRSVVFSLRNGPATNIYVYTVASGDLKQVTSTRNRDICAVFSPDGRYVYYSSNDDGTSRIWRVRIDGAERPEPMFWEAVGGFQPSADGKWMYFTEGGQSLSLVRRNIQDGSSETIFHTDGIAPFIDDIVIANGYVYVAVATNDNAQATIYQISPETKAAKIVAHLTKLPPSYVGGFVIAPDGKSIIVSEATHDASSLYSETLN